VSAPDSIPTTIDFAPPATPSALRRVLAAILNRNTPYVLTTERFSHSNLRAVFRAALKSTRSDGWGFD